jgi:hypothetical protein
MKLEFLMEFNADIQLPTRNSGVGPIGTRVLAVCTGGDFKGPKLRGKIWAAGGDWALRRRDGTASLDVRATLETDDGALIYVQYYGILRPEVGRPTPQPGVPSEYGDAYFFTAPRFETGDERYVWLNSLVCVAEGRRTNQGVAYRVYTLQND